MATVSLDIRAAIGSLPGLKQIGAGGRSGSGKRTSGGGKDGGGGEEGAAAGYVVG